MCSLVDALRVVGCRGSSCPTTNFVETAGCGLQQASVCIRASMAKRKSGQGAQGGKAKAAKPDQPDDRLQHIVRVTDWLVGRTTDFCR